MSIPSHAVPFFQIAMTLPPSRKKFQLWIIGGNIVDQESLSDKTQQADAFSLADKIDPLASHLIIDLTLCE